MRGPCFLLRSTPFPKTAVEGGIAGKPEFRGLVQSHGL